MKTWLPVVGYEGKYEVSFNGLVKSMLHKNIRLLKPRIRNGYPSVILSNNGTTKTKFIHRLVGEAYIKNPDQLKQINHKDFNRTNNNVSNLEWASQSNNTKHAYLHGKIKTRHGERHPLSRIKTEDILEVRYLYQCGLSQSKIGHIKNIPQPYVSRIVLRKAWKHI